MFYVVLVLATAANVAFFSAVISRQPIALSLIKIVLGLNFPLIVFFGDAVPSDLLMVRLAFVTPQVVLVQLRSTDLLTQWLDIPASKHSSG